MSFVVIFETISPFFKKFVFQLMWPLQKIKSLKIAFKLLFSLDIFVGALCFNFPEFQLD